MSTKVEKFPRSAQFYEWKMTAGINYEEPHLYNKKFINSKTELFRIWLKMTGKNHSSPNPAILFLLITKFQNMGLGVFLQT